tara:strand:+ start:293 stop:487 length:195 start_codon:yes stop_codon:yes gene_type:complete
MRLPVNKIIDLEEYTIRIEYDGKGGLDITVLDELQEEIEGIYISDSTDLNNTSEEDSGIKFNPN